MLRQCRLLVRKIKRLIEFIAYWAFDSLVLLTCRRQGNANTVAIVHIELLGDYVLWLPYGLAMVRHLRRQHRVVLVLNAAVLPLARRHFADCMLLGIDRVLFVRNLVRRATLLRALRAAGVGVTYHDTYPRDAIVEDAAVRALGAPAWGFDVTFADRPWLDCWLSRHLYSRLLPPMPGVFQGKRHQAFMRAIGVADEDLRVPVDFAMGFNAQGAPPYFVVAPGASRYEKRWPVSHFIAVTRTVLSLRPHWRCIVVGTPDERELANSVVNALGGQVVNLAGETSLEELIGYIAHARLVIGNDSAVCHIGAACGVPCVVVVGGGHYGRFFPYEPTEAPIQHLPLTASEVMDCFGCDWICRYRLTKGAPYPCITAISPQRVCEEVGKLLL